MDGEVWVDLALIVFDQLSKRDISGGALYAEWDAAKAENRPVDVARFKALSDAAKARLGEKLGVDPNAG